MNGIKMFLAGLLVPLAFQAVSLVAVNTAHAVTRRDTPSVSSTRTIPSLKPVTITARTASSDKSVTTTRNRSVAVSSRESTNNAHPAQAPEKSVSTRTATRSKSQSDAQSTRTNSQSRNATARQPVARTTKNRATNTRARTATPSSNILNRDFSKCRAVFFDCMDEFCANKDSQLKRCACSSRIHEFDSTKKRLANVEDKLLDFSQRLLTVNLDKEDALAINTPTQGELAYATKDTSESKKMLDEIAKKLNNSFNDNNFDQNLNAISLSLNIESAFDNLDSMAGASTTTKSGTELHAAALPICREMATEVCSPEDITIAENSYLVAIESDCNIVKKSYQTQVDQARAQVFESGALLDMSRLDIHQKRNSDDILTCKHKMLDMLTDSTVCGADMGKCLDTSGRYIDPTTGQAFLTPDLANLTTLITRPESNQTWVTAPGNEHFVTFLNSKKKFLEPAMENCQDISDYVWNEFLEDALSQIKLAQEEKLEQVRQSCTTLTTQCLDNASDSITSFDARALSIFGVTADKTVNAMCAEVQNACAALMETTPGTDTWDTGMTEIATNKTYETILQTCQEVGRACIIQACATSAGNFVMCENMDTSINRKSILERTACWDEVVDCVASAGSDTLAKIQTLHALDAIQNNNTATIHRTFYGEMYNITNSDNITLHPNGGTTIDCITNMGSNCVHDICNTQCVGSTPDGLVSTECYTCRLAERIWGNCEAPTNTNLAGEAQETTLHNRIKTNSDTDTLLAWFARNTGTDTASDSCRNTGCRPGYVFSTDGQCVPSGNVDSAGITCLTAQRFTIYDDFTNCCETGVFDSLGNCCESDNVRTITATNYFVANGITNNIIGQSICAPADAQTATLIASYTQDNIAYNIVCLGTVSWTGTSNNAYPNGQSVQCNGSLVLIDSNGHYIAPTSLNNARMSNVSSYYNMQSADKCAYSDTGWSTCISNQTTTCHTPDNWHINYSDDVCNTTTP